jgi:2-oxo-3-hexenedioate decarboxylase
VADNASAAAFVVGAWRSVGSAADLQNLGVVMEINGEVVETGSTAAILGDPLRALPAIARMARLHDLALPAGLVILAGAATAASPLPPGAAVVATITGLGRVQVSSRGGDHG